MGKEVKRTCLSAHDVHRIGIGLNGARPFHPRPHEPARPHASPLRRTMRMMKPLEGSRGSTSVHVGGAMSSHRASVAHPQLPVWVASASLVAQLHNVGGERERGWVEMQGVRRADAAAATLLLRLRTLNPRRWGGTSQRRCRCRTRRFQRTRPRRGLQRGRTTCRRQLPGTVEHHQLPLPSPPQRLRSDQAPAAQ